MKSKKWILPLLLMLVAALIGACIGQLLEHLNWFQYSSEFNIFELIYFLVSVFIAGYIANILQKGEQDRRGEKDLFIEKFKEIDGELATLLMGFSGTSKGEFTIEHDKLVGDMKIISVIISRYQTALLRCYPELKENNSGYQSLKLSELRPLTTMNKKGDTTIRCVSKIWYYNGDRMAQIKAEINRLRNVCFDDILLINAL